MYCYKCGKKIDDDSNFCPFCGADLKDRTEEQNELSLKIDNSSIEDNCGDLSSDSVKNCPQDDYDEPVKESIEETENIIKEYNNDEVYENKSCDSKAEGPKEKKDYSLTFVILLLIAAIFLILIFGSNNHSGHSDEFIKNSKNQPYLYWYFDFVDPHPDDDCDDCYYMSPAIDENGYEIEGEYCLYFGVEPHKDTNSPYYLTKEEDHGVMKGYLNYFQVGDVVGATRPSYSSKCGYMMNEIDFVDDQTVMFREGRVDYLLFEISETQLNDVMEIKYVDNVFGELYYE